MIFQPAKNQSAYAKIGVMGFAGSGKTFTSASVAIGLHKYIKSQNPIFFLDTETGSDFLIPKFKQAGIQLYTSKSRAFVDLLNAVDHAEKEKGILIIDSISHFWLELMEAFKKRRNLDRLFFQHWGPIKEEWRQFTDRYVNSRCHIIMCGRAGWEYDYQEDAEGVKELHKTGTKMKAETEMGYEPSLLIEMEKVRQGNGNIGGAFLNRAWILKDRFDEINGQHFDNPTFESFLPHISQLNIGGDHLGVDTTRHSRDIFDTDSSAFFRKKEKEICLEEIISVLDKNFDTRSSAGKKERIEILEKVFGTASKTKLEMMPLEAIKVGLDHLRAEVNKPAAEEAPPPVAPSKNRVKKEKVKNDS